MFLESWTQTWGLESLILENLDKFSHNCLIREERRRQEETSHGRHQRVLIHSQAWPAILISPGAVSQQDSFLQPKETG